MKAGVSTVAVRRRHQRRGARAPSVCVDAESRRRRRSTSRTASLQSRERACRRIARLRRRADACAGFAVPCAPPDVQTAARLSPKRSRLAAVYDTDPAARGSTRRGRSWRGTVRRRRQPACDALREVGAVVGDPAGPDEPRARQRSSSATAAAAIASSDALDRARAAARRGVVLPGGRARAARAVAGAARRAARGGTRRQAHQGRARAGAGARPAAAGRLFRHRALSLLRRRRARGAQVAALLLLLPGGDRAAGPAGNAARARAAAQLLRGEADYQLHWLYLWYEHQPARALELLRGLDARYPSNPLFLQRIAEVERRHTSRSRGERRAWQTLLDRATRRRSQRPRSPSARPHRSRAASSPSSQRVARSICSSTGRSRGPRRRTAPSARASRARRAYDASAIAIARDRVRDTRDRQRTSRRSRRHAHACARGNRAARSAADRIFEIFDNSVLLCLTSEISQP